jgi:hypothetical protein
VQSIQINRTTLRKRRKNEKRILPSRQGKKKKERWRICSCIPNPEVNQMKENGGITCRSKLEDLI